MFLEEKIITKIYIRTSKLGKNHVYYRKSRCCIFRCDNCNKIFERAREKINPKRLSNNYFHCCSNCNAKKFAQAKGAERKTIWDKLASSLDNISKI